MSLRTSGGKCIVSSHSGGYFRKCSSRKMTYLGAENANFEEMPKYALNNHLRMFFASIRTEKGEELKKSTMFYVKYCLLKYLKDKCRIDISTDNDFVAAIKTFKAKLTDLQKKGKGSVVHKPQIADYDMKLMDPANVAFNVNTPFCLQNKVWFDIMEKKKTTFAVEVDSFGREYVRQIMDEAEKKHGIDSTPDDTIGEARMYARPCDDMCPVKYFKRYMNFIDDLWQRPRDSFNTTDDCWFCKSPLGRILLGNMMSQISTTAALSQKYTNHCIRATSISALDMAGLEARQIIRATGHKSETSIKSYASRLTEGTKRKMSDALSSAFLGAEQNAPMTSDIFPNCQRMIKYFQLKMTFQK
ncbi:LOW QUALITY PROTEIN: hypothetical protein MAR_018703 [Mya arenaria]|uniref:DUF3504 domain-containing protein n=1 Tax=Mya arenaria TaxID=6604 RepID=A0ABY7EFU6_MYAAR|nr:LOW QUALITY PROTEIN: hypothetical protein MAR_018703 [Mya arenaria]